MTIDPGTFVAIGVPFVLAVVWMVRLEGRINVTDARYDDIIARLQRIEENQDRRNNPRVIENP